MGMADRVIIARRASKMFTEAQLAFGERVWTDIKNCWNVDAFDDEACARADREVGECKRDWMLQALEDDVVSDVDEFFKLLWVVEEMDMSSMAYC